MPFTKDRRSARGAAARLPRGRACHVDPCTWTVTPTEVDRSKQILSTESFRGGGRRLQPSAGVPGRILGALRRVLQKKTPGGDPPGVLTNLHRSLTAR